MVKEVVELVEARFSRVPHHSGRAPDVGKGTPPKDFSCPFVNKSWAGIKYVPDCHE